MTDAPLTKAAAKLTRYGTRKGMRYSDKYCAYEVWSKDGWSAYQCSRKPGHGPDELYCKQHATKLAEREEQ